jgi:hypothetical protein
MTEWSYGGNCIYCTPLRVIAPLFIRPREPKSTCVCKQANWEYLLNCITNSLNTDLLGTAKEIDETFALLLTSCVELLDKHTGNIRLT